MLRDIVIYFSYCVESKEDLNLMLGKNYTSQSEGTTVAIEKPDLFRKIKTVS